MKHKIFFYTNTGVSLKEYVDSMSFDEYLWNFSRRRSLNDLLMLDNRPETKWIKSLGDMN